MADIKNESKSSFFEATRIIRVVTGPGVIMAYNLSHKRTGASPLPGSLGALPFRLLVMFCTPAATVGAVLKVC